MGGRTHHAENIPSDLYMRAEFTDLGRRVNEAVSNHAPNQQRACFWIFIHGLHVGPKNVFFFFLMENCISFGLPISLSTGLHCF